MNLRKYRESVTKLMTKPFPTQNELIYFIGAHLLGLYEAFHEAEQEGDESLMDYCQGSIDTTHIYLLKSGCEDFITYEEYLDNANSNWKKV
jgi:hypothetical protein